MKTIQKMKTMKTSKFFTAAALLTGALLLNSCENKDIPQDESNKPVSFTAEIGRTAKPQPKAAGTAWTNGDPIGIFMVDKGTTDIAENAVNKKHVTSAGDGIFQPETGQEIWYPMDETQKVDFIAYYPHQAGATLTNEIDITIGAQTNQPAFDLMWTKTATGYDKITNKTTPVSLNFDHKLAKLVMNCTAGTGVASSNLATMTVTIKGMNTKNKFNLATGTLGTANTVADITPNKLADAKYDAIIMPATATTALGAFSVEFVLANNDKFVWDMPAGTEFLPGNEYTYEVTLNRTGVSVTGTIQPWTPNDKGGVAAE